MKSPLRILYLEDDRQDVELVRARLEEEGFICDMTHVETQADFVAALDKGGFDLILADYNLPSFDGISALAITREKTSDIPFLFLSGVMGEELAIETLKNGATDYVLKQRLSRLGPSIHRALREAKEHYERKKAEEELRKYQEHLEELIEKRTAELRTTNVELQSVNDKLKAEIRARERMQAALELSEERFKRMVSAVTAYTYSVQISRGRVIYTKHSMGCLSITGYSPEEYKSDPDLWYSMIYPDDKIIVENAISEILAGYKAPAIEHRIIRRDGTIIWIRNTIVPYYNEDGVLIRYDGLIEDISERKHLEEALRASEARYRAIVEDQTELINRWTPDGTLTFVNEAVCRYFGKNRDELIGHSFMPFIHEDDRAALKKSIESLGWETPVQTYEHRVVLPTGEIRWHQWINRALFNDRRDIVEFQAVGRDITEQKQAEEDLKRLADELKRSNNDLQQFAYIAAHDLQAPLHAVDGYVRLIAGRYKDKLDKNANEFIEGTIDSVKNMRDLIRDLLEYSEVGSSDLHMKEVDCSSVLNKVISGLQTAIEKTKAVISHDKLPSLVVDASQISRLFQNLISNALKYHGEELPIIHISAQRRENEWVFSVKDNGIGIAPDQTGRIFEMFRRLHGKREYPGTGIGLAICKRIVKRHGGRIWVESEPGKGSVFYFTIPDRREIP